MTDPEGIQREPPDQQPQPSGIQPTPSPDVPAPAAGPQKCPHCGNPQTRDDVAGGRCWYCDKRLTDPVEAKPPRPPRPPFLATFLFGFVGAILGFGVGYVLTQERIGQGSWTVSLCGGIGFATGSAFARSMYRKR
jgi:hypothetical protein